MNVNSLDFFFGGGRGLGDGGCGVGFLTAQVPLVNVAASDLWYLTKDKTA